LLSPWPRSRSYGCGIEQIHRVSLPGKQHYARSPHQTQWVDPAGLSIVVFDPEQLADGAPFAQFLPVVSNGASKPVPKSLLIMLGKIRCQVTLRRSAHDTCTESDIKQGSSTY
jgi:hypothetical protein